MIADYFCTDESGGSGVGTCEGPVSDGAVVPNGLGSHRFTVRGTDAEGNVGTATHGYVVFDDIGGPIDEPDLVLGRTRDPDRPEAGRAAPGPRLRERIPAGARRRLCDRRDGRNRSARQRAGERHQRTTAPSVADGRRLGRLVPVARGPARLQRLVDGRRRVHGSLRLTRRSPALPELLVDQRPELVATERP